MTLPYAFRLLCLCLAAFFLIHFALALAVSALTSAALRTTVRMRARAAARLMLALRLAPAVCSLVIVTGLCVPSYLWLEPEGSSETTGLACLAMALLGAGLWIVSLSRTLRAVAGSLMYRRQWLRGTALRVSAFRVWLTDGTAPILALVGILRPRLVVSRAVLSALSPEQLEAALSHERAHETSRDNFKRLLFLLAPGVLPFRRGFAGIDRAWARFAELAADDASVAGNARRSLSLAGALVCVARISSASASAVPHACTSSLLADTIDLQERVERLLNTPEPCAAGRRRLAAAAAGGMLVIAAAIAFATIEPATLHSVHGLLERLIR